MEDHNYESDKSDATFPTPGAKLSQHWRFSVEKILKEYNQTFEGYTEKQYEELSKKFDKNELPEEEKESIFEKIYEQFQDTLVRILLAAAVVSFILALTSDGHEGISAYIEPLVILLILIANASIGVWQDINADKAIDALQRLQASTCNVKRGGVEKAIDSVDLIPGDIVVLNEGEKVPADIRIVDVISSNFEVDESNLTGEPVSVYKCSDAVRSRELNLKDQSNICFSSTCVTIGKAVGLVIHTGKDTQLGKIGKDVQDSKDNEKKSPLKLKLEEFGDYLTKIIGVICLLVWVINYKNFFDEIHGTFFNGMIYYFKISVALAVAAIPEGLPAVITTCLALGSRRMSANNAIVRKLDAIETLGCTNVICTDKTGTLTTNNMTVKSFMLVSDQNKLTEFTVSGSSFNPNGVIVPLENNDLNRLANLKTMALITSLCNISTIKYDEENKNYFIGGSPTEGAMKVLVEKFRAYDDNFTDKSSKDPQVYNNFILKNYEVLHLLEFDRVRKTMSVIALDKTTKKPVLLTKGALDFVINKCDNCLTNDGTEVPLTQELKNKIVTLNTNYMSKSLRTLGLFIRKDLDSLLNGVDLSDKKYFKNLFKNRNQFAEFEQKLTFVGCVGMMDPPRPEVQNAILTCAQAQIRVIMITGDDKNTAEAIGKEIKLVTGNLENCSFTTNEFFKLPEYKQRELISKDINFIFSRSEPSHKKRLVSLLKSFGNVVAMTGDGVNDAPALAESDIGISMGITGTDVAKGASKIILADDNFATIVKAVEEGRSIYMNMKAFIRYLISSNIGEVVAIFITSFFGIPEAFTSIQLLWVNLVTDGPPATALGFNPSEKNIMTKPPRSDNDPLINNWVIFRYFLIGLYVGMATIGIFAYWYVLYEHDDGHTLVSWKQLTNWMECSKWTDFKVNNFMGLDFSTDPCSYFSVGKRKAASLSLTVLVVIEMFNAMNAISDESSVLVIPPYKNVWLIVAVFFSVSLHCMILYIPFFNGIFGIAPLDLNEWMLVIVFSLPVILLEEIIKVFARYVSKKNQKVKTE